MIKGTQSGSHNQLQRRGEQNEWIADKNSALCGARHIYNYLLGCISALWGDGGRGEGTVSVVGKGAVEGAAVGWYIQSAEKTENYGGSKISEREREIYKVKEEAKE